MKIDARITGLVAAGTLSLGVIGGAVLLSGHKPAPTVVQVVRPADASVSPSASAKVKPRLARPADVTDTPVSSDVPSTTAAPSTSEAPATSEAPPVSEPVDPPVDQDPPATQGPGGGPLPSVQPIPQISPPPVEVPVQTPSSGSDQP